MREYTNTPFNFMPNCNYVLRYTKQHIPWLDVEYTVSNIPAVLDLYYALWRPGRYEEGKYLKNVRALKFFINDKRFTPERLSINHWQINGEKGATVKVTFQYYAKDLNAGSTTCAHNLFYVNPATLGIYAKQFENNEKAIKLIYPENWDIKGALPKINETGLYVFTDIHHWFDTPFYASDYLQTLSFELKGYNFNLHFYGNVNPDFKKIRKDFVAFMACQINDFGKFTVPEYHYLYLISDKHAYHGVEHLASTVIYLGPGKDLNDDGYHPFVEISSHEFYHSWNVKSIRPADWMPYDYSKQMPSTLGFIAEGITTHMGDCYLLKSGVFDKEWFAKEMSDHLTKYVQNFGRYHISVADSSYETWVDGYEKGVPDRKVSIYNEGAILAFVVEYLARKHSDNEIGLPQIMKAIYENDALMKNGISKENWKAILHTYLPNEADDLFYNYYYGTADYRYYAYEALDYFGFEVTEIPSQHFTEANLGLKVRHHADFLIVTDVNEGTYAYDEGFHEGDYITHINGEKVTADYESVLEKFKGTKTEFKGHNDFGAFTRTIHSDDKVFYKEVKVTPTAEMNILQRKAYNKFSGRK